MSQLLDQTRRFALTRLLPRLQEEPLLRDRVALAQIGHGSQCLGYDDDLSQDHDWGILVQCFLEDATDDSRYVLQQCLASMPDLWEGTPVVWDQRTPPERSGIIELRVWLHDLAGYRLIPNQISTEDFLRLSDARLTWLTNGTVFHDPIGTISRLRQTLRVCPPQIQLRRLATACLMTVIHGPYQIPRLLKRTDGLSARLSAGLFVRSAMITAHRILGKPAPIIKWLARSFKALPDNSGISSDELEAILSATSLADAIPRVNAVCNRLAMAIRCRYPPCRSPTLFELAFEIESMVSDPVVKVFPFWAMEEPL